MGADRELPHRLVVRNERRKALDDFAKKLRPPGVARDARHLLVDLDRLGRLADVIERAREQAEGVEVSGVRLKADLELGQRLHAVVGCTSRKVELGSNPRVRGLGLMMKQPLNHLERVVAATELRQLPRRDGELRHGSVAVLGMRERFGEAQVRQRIGRVELDDFAEDFDGFVVAALPLQPRGHLVERRQRIARQSELLVELGELGRDVRVFLLELRDVLRDDLADLLVDGDGLERKALARVELADTLVRRDRVRVRLHLGLEVANLQQGPRVVRILLDDLLILRDRPVVLLFLDVLLGGNENLIAVNRHDSERSSGSGL